MSETNVINLYNSWTPNINLELFGLYEYYDVAKFNENMTKIDTEVGNLRTKNTEQDTAISNIQTKNTEQDTAISNLQNAISGQGGDISGLRTDITNLQNNKMNKNFDNVSGTLPITNGGTGATTSEQARQNLGIGASSVPTMYGLELRYIDFHKDPQTPTLDYEQRLITDENTGDLILVGGSSSGTATLDIWGHLKARTATINNVPFRPIYVQPSFPSGAPEGSLLAW